MALITVREAADRAGMHPNTVRNWIRAGLIRSYRIVPNSQIFMKDKEFDRLCARIEVSLVAELSAANQG